MPFGSRLHGLQQVSLKKTSLTKPALDFPHFRRAQPPKFSHSAIGTIYNKNTIEEFKALDKLQLLADEGKELLADMCSGGALRDPSLLTRFFVLSFADLKCHSYYYWFAFPCPLTPTLKLQGAVQKLRDLPNSSSYIMALKALPTESQNFFILYANVEKNIFEARSLSSLTIKMLSSVILVLLIPASMSIRLG